MIIAVVLIAAIAAIVLTKHGATSSKSNLSTTPSPTVSSSSATATYKDGEYSATGAYESPGGQETVGVDLKISAGVITSLTVTPGATDPTSQEYQSKFVSGIQSIIVGKPLSSNFDVSEVNGSSLTGTGFSQALTSIKSKASA